MILIDNNFACDTGQILTDPDGNFIIIELTILTKRITLVSIYGPNENKPNFYKKKNSSKRYKILEIKMF